MEIVITTNSPGEVTGWLTPALRALQALTLPAHVTVFVPPCPFASGTECAVVRDIPGVDLVVGPRGFLLYALLGLRPRGFQPGSRGVVLYLGGDLAHASLLARKLRYPAVAYTEGAGGAWRAFSRLAVPYSWNKERLVRKGVPGDRVNVTGNLMLDAVAGNRTREEIRRTMGLGDDPLLLLMPGSRPQHFRHMAPFFLQAAARIVEARPEVRCVLSASPFVPDEQLQRIFRSVNRESKRDDFSSLLGPPVLVYRLDGLRIPVYRGRQNDLMAAADLALTIPGTNTVELAFHGVPMVVALQLAHPEHIPVEGPLGLIGALPLLGPVLKKILLPRLAARIRFAAWPNRLAAEEIVPEIRGKLRPSDVSRVALFLLADHERRRVASARLRAVVGESGASRRLAEMVQEVLTERYGEIPCS